ncbi:MAG: glycosyltransferase family 39 protein [Anaerolineae bacterium]|nr:glycosyltransferase family 39 protein [Anaerolineae bacterium]
MSKLLNISERYWLPAILVLCLAARLGALLIFGRHLAFEGDVVHGEGGYDVRAQNLLATGVLGIEAGQVDVETSTVLYPVLLAVAYAVGGRSLATVSVLNILFDLVTVWAVYQLGRQLLGRPTIGALAGVFFALYPYLIFQTLSVSYTSLLTMLLSLTALSFVALRERQRLDSGTWLVIVACGVSIGLLALTRAPAVLVALGGALWLLFRLSLWQSIVRLVPAALTSLAVIAPWLWQTYQTFNRFVPIGGNLGVALWGGNSPYTVPFIQAGYSLSWLPEHLDVQAQSGEVAERLLENRERLISMALAYLRENPDQIPALLFWKLYAQWTPDIFPMRNPINGVVPFVRQADGTIRVLTEPEEIRAHGFATQGDIYAEPLFSILGRWAHRIYFGGLLILALVGLWQTRHAWRDVSLIWLILFILTAFHVLTTPYTRYRAPSDPLLFLFSAHAVLHFWTQHGRSPQVEVQNA